MQIFFRGLCAFAEWVSDDAKVNGRFTVILPNESMRGGEMMPSMSMHHAALSIPVTGYTATTEEPACIVPSGLAPSDAQWQPYGTPLAIWELDGREVTITPEATNPVVDKGQALGYKSLGFLPALGVANQGDDWIDPRFVRGTAPTVKARVQLIGGMITAALPAHPMMTTKKWSFGSRKDVGYTDQVSYVAGPSDAYSLVLTDLAGKRPPVTIDIKRDVILFLTHLPKDATKEHFMVYWSLLQNPNPKMPVPQDGQSFLVQSVKGSYPGDCLNGYVRFKP